MLKGTPGASPFIWSPVASLWVACKLGACAVFHRLSLSAIEGTMRAWIQRNQVELRDGLRDGFAVAIFLVLMVFGLSYISREDYDRNVILSLYVLVGSVGVATVTWKLWGSQAICATERPQCHHRSRPLMYRTAPTAS